MDKMNREKRTERELREASDHLRYEIWMFTSVAHGLGSGVVGEGPIANALIESFTIHMRALMEFLYNDTPRVDDVIAEDYFSTPEEWYDLRPKLTDLLRQSKDRAGKEIAHLTYVRLMVTPETNPWPFIQIANEIHSAIDVFLKSVPKNKLGEQWLANV